MTDLRALLFPGVQTALTCLILLFTLLEPAHADDWPQFLGPQADGTSSETGLINEWPNDGVPIVWRREVGTGYSAPSVRDDKLIIFHRTGNEEIVECLSAKDGTPIWKYAYPSSYRDPYGYNNGPRCSPIITADRVITYGAEGVLSSIALDSGELVWQSKTSERWNIPEAFFGVGSTPVLDGDKLYVAIGAQPESGLICMRADNGTVLWECIGKSTWDGKPKTGWRGEPLVKWTGFEKMASYSTPTIATIHGRRVVLALMRQGLVMVDADLGEVLDSFWFRANVNESVNAINPVVIGNEVFISGAYYRVGSVMLGVDKNFKFKERWRGLSLEAHWSTPIVHDGHLYSFSGRNERDARFRCIEWATGVLKWDRDESWQRRSRTPDTFGRGSAIKADGHLITLGEGGLLGLAELDPEKLTEISRWQVPGLEHPCWAAPVLSNKRLFLRSESQLVCLNLAE